MKHHLQQIIHYTKFFHINKKMLTQHSLIRSKSTVEVNSRTSFHATLEVEAHGRVFFKVVSPGALIHHVILASFFFFFFFLRMELD